MNLRKSWINIPLLKNIIKRNTLPVKISLASFLAMAVLSISSDVALMLSLLIIFVSAVLLTTCYAGLIQGYMTNKTDANHMASIPLTKKTIWFTHYLSGVVLTFGTLLIEAIVSVLLIRLKQDFIFDFSLLGVPELLLRFIIPIIILFFIYYSISFFVACIAGNRIGQIVFTIAFYIVPVLLYLGFVQVGISLAPGGMGIGIDNSTILYLPFPLASGLKYLSNISNNEWNWPYLFWHIVMGIGFFIASYRAYKDRPLENIGQAILYKKMQYVIKACIVLAAALMLYLLLIYSSTIVYGFSYRELLGPLAIYVLCGVLAAISLELLFKNNKVYRSLWAYIPMLVVSFGLCYFIGNQHYQQEIEYLYKSEGNIIDIWLYDGNNQAYMYADLSASKDNQALRELVVYLDEHRDKLLSNTDDNEATITISISYTIDETRNQYGYINYIMEEKVFKEYVNNNSQVLTMFLETGKDSTSNTLKQSEYLVVEDDWSIVSILDAEQIARLKPLILKERPYRYEDLFTNQRYNGYGLSGDDMYFSTLKNVEIENILKEEKGIQRKEDFMQCQNMINTFNYHELKDSFLYQGNADVDSTILSLGQDIIIYDDDFTGSIVSMTQNTITISVTFEMFVDEAIAKENNTLAGSVQVATEITFVSQDGKMIIDNIVEKEVLNV